MFSLERRLDELVRAIQTSCCTKLRAPKAFGNSTLKGNIQRALLRMEV